MINRRGFLKSILALGAAPVIVKAENLMKIFVPSQELILPDKTIEVTTKLFTGYMDEVRVTNWIHLAVVRRANTIKTFVDGVESQLPESVTFADDVIKLPKHALVDELRITTTARPENFLLGYQK